MVGITLEKLQRGADRTFSIVTISLHAVKQSHFQCIYAFIYMLVLLLLLYPITERNVREMDDAQELAYGILAWFWNTCICAHKYIYELYSCSWLQLAGILSPQINIGNRCDSQMVGIQRLRKHMVLGFQLFIFKMKSDYDQIIYKMLFLNIR